MGFTGAMLVAMAVDAVLGWPGALFVRIGHPVSWLGGLIGAGFAYFIFNGYRTSTMNFQSFSQVSFAFQVKPGLLAMGIIWAALIGAIGGIFPAIRAARLPIASALREM